MNIYPTPQGSWGHIYTPGIKRHCEGDVSFLRKLGNGREKALTSNIIFRSKFRHTFF